MNTPSRQWVPLSSIVVAALCLALIGSHQASANEPSRGAGLGLMIEPIRIEAAPNQVVSLAITTDRYNNPAPIRLSVEDETLPAGVLVSFSPAKIQIAETDKTQYHVSQNALCEIALHEGAQPGSYRITIKAEDGTLSAENTVILTIVAGR